MAGDFPGSYQIPGTRRVSLAIGGFVKTVAISDSNAEMMGADFLPATLGTRRADEEGAFSLDPTLTRIHFDARSPARTGQLRGYVEYDLNAGNDGSLGVKLRHAYGAWTQEVGTLTAGHTWSTMMDPKCLPEGLTEPTVSGVIFSRQPLVRWSQALAPGTSMHLALEDPSSSDFSSDDSAVGQTSVPDAGRWGQVNACSIAVTRGLVWSESGAGTGGGSGIRSQSLPGLRVAHGGRYQK